MVEEFTNTDEMQSQLQRVLQDKFGGNNNHGLEGGKRKKASKKASKKGSKKVSKKSSFDQYENLKALGIPIVAPGFDVNSEGRIVLPKGYKANFATAKQGMYKKSKY